MLFAGKGYSQGKVKSTQSSERVMLKEKEPIRVGTPVRILGDTTFCVKPYQQKTIISAKQKKTAKPIQHAQPLGINVSPQPIYPVKPIISDRNKQIDNTKNENIFQPISLCEVHLGGISVRTARFTRAQQIKKIVKDSVKLAFSKPSTILSIYPNPLTTRSLLHIEFVSKMEGAYSISIADLNGIRIQQEKFIVESNITQREMKLNGTLVAGVYVLQILGPDGKITATQKIIVGE
jgi:hypothetical protein